MTTGTSYSARRFLRLLLPALIALVPAVAAAQTQSVTSFTLINADTDRPVTGFDPIPNNALIDLASMPTQNLNVRANTNPPTVGSVRFKFDTNANYRTDSATPYALGSETGGNYAAWTPAVGAHTIVATPYTASGAGGTAGTPLTLNFTATRLRINAGGPAYTDTASHAWAADALFSGGTAASTTSAVTGTTDPKLYQTERYGNFSYAIPVTNGAYTVTLLFAEIYWKAAGKRIFDVAVEGQQVIHALDIWATVGANVALVRTVQTTVTDGTLNINFTSTVDFAKVSAIQVTAAAPAGNQAPVVSTGADQTITQPANSVTLTGAATDDGLPSPPAALTYGWSAVSGPGPVTFSAPAALSTDATFTVAGSYTLRLTASDSALSSTADTHVTVNPVGTNQAPVVSAGSDQTITLPTNSVTLTGTATDDGLPSPPNALTYAWSTVSGPGTVTFSAPTALSTSAAFSASGGYTLRLTVSDSALVKTADVHVTVNPAFTAVRINGGGPAYTDTGGHVWSADTAFTGGTAASTTATITGTSDPKLYQTERYGNFSYNIAVPNGQYTVTLMFAEIYWTAAGKRIFDVAVEGQQVIHALDIWATVGANVALVRTVQTTVADGTLNINFTSTVDFAKISAIQVAAAAPAGNQAPVVSTGVDQTITLPTNTVSLTATASDDGLPAPPAAMTYAWSVVSGPGAVTFSVPAALSTNATFASAGTYTLRLTASDSLLTGSADTHITVNPPGAILLTMSPRRGSLVALQSMPVTATVQNDVGGAGVTWTVSGTACTGSDCGAFTNVTPTSATYTAPAAGGLYTITATSVADGTASASASFGVTDSAGVLTYHNNVSRDGTNTREFALTTSSVQTATFGKVFSCQADGAIYSQPLWVPGVTVGGVQHNVVIVATQHDSVYAFDADASPCVTLWHANLLDAAHGAGSGETTVPSGTTGLVGAGFGDISPEVGITGTPVVNAGSNTVYVVGKSVKAGSPNVFFQRLHALDLTSGGDIVPPEAIDGALSVPGNGDGSMNGQVPFDPKTELQRPGLVLANGVVYVSWASHEDADPYHGWVIGFDAQTLAPVPGGLFNTTPNHTGTASYARGGIWMGGGAPAVDAGGNLYLITGNGTFNANVAGGTNYGDSVIRLSTAGGLSAADYFTPSNQSTLDGNDTDLGSGGAAILIDQPTAPFPRLLVGGGKDGNLFLLNRDSLGQYNSGSNSVVQTVSVGSGVFATPAFWQNSLYIASAKGALKQFVFSTTTGKFDGGQSPQSVTVFGFPGVTASVSSSGATNGIVWALDTSQYCTNQSKGCGPAVLHAFDATNLAVELWNSSQAAGQRDAAGRAVKFAVPTVVNGKAYIGTRGNDASVLGELDVYGLLPN